MAYTTHPTPTISAIATRGADIFVSFGRSVVRACAIAQSASSIAREVEKLNATSDEKLAEQGKTRPGEIDRIFTKYAHI